MEKNFLDATPRQVAVSFIVWILPNILFWWTSHYFGYERAWINLDYGIGLVFWFIGWKWLGGLVMIMAFIIDVLTGATQVYAIFDPGQLLQLLHFARQARPGFLIFFLSVFLAGCGIFLLMWRLIESRSINFTSTLCALAPVVFLNIAPMLDELENQQADFHLDKRTVFIGSQMDYLHRIFFRSMLGEHLSRAGESEFYAWQEPTAVNTAWPGFSNVPSRALVIVAESWGLPLNALELKNQTKAIVDSTNFQVINSGSVKFSGGTVAGELRELCKMASTGINFSAIDGGDACLPSQLRAKGYETVALHAASGSMYHRNDWYSTVGFDKSIFSIDANANARRCFSFPGLCDADLFPLVVEKLAAKEKSFVYWMTLNSHLPYDARDLLKRRDGECAELGLAVTSQRCMHYSLITEFFEGLAEALKRPELAGTEVVVVGDHAPPFFEKSARESFVGDSVAFLHFKVLGGAAQGGQ